MICTAVGSCRSNSRHCLNLLHSRISGTSQEYVRIWRSSIWSKKKERRMPKTTRAPTYVWCCCRGAWIGKHRKVVSWLNILWHLDQELVCCLGRGGALQIRGEAEVYGRLLVLLVKLSGPSYGANGMWALGPFSSNSFQMCVHASDHFLTDTVLQLAIRTSSPPPSINEVPPSQTWAPAIG